MNEPNITQTGYEGLDHIEPIQDDWVAQIINPGAISNSNKINEVIETVNLIIDILNERLSHDDAEKNSEGDDADLMGALQDMVDLVRKMVEKRER